MVKAIDLFNKELILLFKFMTKIIYKNPSYLKTYLLILDFQKKSIVKRNDYLKEGISVPPIAIFSITNKCNLTCAGCYANAQNRCYEDEVDISIIKKTITEGKELGISTFLLAGGEPLLREEIFEIAKNNSEIIFPVFTNGTLFNDEILFAFKYTKNLFPVISLEGDQTFTDERRGEGIYIKTVELMEKLYSKGIIFGVSFTINRNNYDTVIKSNFIKKLYNNGCKAFFFVEYVPTNENDIKTCLTDEQKSSIPKTLESLRNEFNAIFICLPGDEDKYGGCLAAGRGFIHISSTGNLEPCPFAPYSDVNIKDISLKEALQSDLLYEIRANHDKLTESKGGCTLWENRNWVESIINSKSSAEG